MTPINPVEKKCKNFTASKVSTRAEDRSVFFNHDSRPACQDNLMEANWTKVSDGATADRRPADGQEGGGEQR